MGSTAAARPDDPPPGGADTPTARFAELRTLLVGPEQRQLRALQTRLDDPVAHARDVSRVLPAAVELRTNDPHLKRALAPTIEESISASVRRNPQPLADALFPIIGPAIRKAIAATLGAMLESLNTSLEHSLSWRSLRWRLDARRTGRPFAEIVLLNTLVYRVEQVFLIHRPSGLLLQHVVAEGTPVQDADMVSAMLTAIRDFVQDSFAVSSDEGLQTLKVGELSVWIENGPHALLAAVIRGTAPPDLRITLQQALESVHARFNDELSTFAGDASAFTAARPALESCLQRQLRARDGQWRRSPTLRAVAVLLVLAAGLWIFMSLRGRARWNGYLDALRAEPGVVVVSAGREGRRHAVSGLRDPLARDPASLLAAHGVDPSDVAARWELYQALDPPIVRARAAQLLAPPPGVSLDVRDGVLTLGGTAPVEWIDATMRIAPVLPGVARVDATALVADAERRLVDAIQSAPALFVKGTTTFAAGGDEVVRQQIARLHELDALARAARLRFVVSLVGETDADGAPESNLPLSRQRATRILGLLEAERFQRVAVTATGIGTRQGADLQAPEAEKQRNRRVAFRVSRAGEGR
jgi:OOP family OmpA-OmpF porin